MLTPRNFSRDSAYMYDDRSTVKEFFVVKTANPKCSLIPERLVAERYSCHVHTLKRWEKDPTLGFPPPVWVRGRRYRDVAALDAWDEANRKAAEAGAAEVAA